MNEKSLKVLEQYELDVRNVRRGRDCYIADTNQGMVLLKEYNGSNQRAQWIRNVCMKVRENGMQTELPIASKEGDFVTCDREDRRYLVKLWVPGRELDSKNETEVLEGVRNLASLHRILTGFTQEHAVCLPDLGQVFDKRMRELRKIFRYVKEKKRKNAFELKFLEEYGYFMELCQSAQERLCTKEAQECMKAAAERGDVCHGDYNQHNVFKQDTGIAAVHFENCGVGCQTMDLYCFMRKMLEKSSWNIHLGDRMLQAYMEVRKLTQQELVQLYIQFEFSEKFWKIANHYYNSKKTWIPDRSLQKLEKLVLLAPKQKAFLEHFHQKYIENFEKFSG